MNAATVLIKCSARGASFNSSLFESWHRDIATAVAIR
jgi:hypothetical protein